MLSEKDQTTALLGQALGLGPEDTPFAWQVRLLGQFLEGAIPRSLDIPTGLGKTATIAIWLIARALGAPVPRRLVYVVDRRAVVDQATEVAMLLRKWVAATATIKEGLGLEDRPLPISTLRGQFVDNREWLEDPAAPAIIIGTVDMVGSRLLFQGYGGTRKMRPYHAGLLANDSLLILDEAHLVAPFERLLERIAISGADLGPTSAAKLAKPPAVRLLSLSATGRSFGGEAFRLDDKTDLANPRSVVSKRLGAKKRLQLHELDGAEALYDAIAKRAWALSEAGAKPIRCIIFTTRREYAEKGLAALSKLAGLNTLKKGTEATADVELLVGGRRVFERTSAASKLRELGFLAGAVERRNRPAFLFATSAGEVGVDLDADHMVCDLVAWERMVQRLGRVNRRGSGDARVEVFPDPHTSKTSEDEAARRQAILELLERLPVGKDGRTDVSPGALRKLQRAAQKDELLASLIERASTPPPLHPALDRPTLDAWSMTSLVSHPGRPVVAPWLRGWIEDRPQTTIVWRSFFPVPHNRSPKPKDIKRFFEAARPHASEKLETESYRVAEWLGKRVARLLKLEKRAGVAGEGLKATEIVAITLGGNDELPRTWTLAALGQEKGKDLAERVLPGVTLVLLAGFAGLGDGLLDHTADKPPSTLDGPSWLEDSGSEAPAVRFRIRETEKATATTDTTWRERERVPYEYAAGADGEVTWWLAVEKWRHDAATEEDRSAGRPQKLDEHQEWTEKRARTLAKRLQLPPAAVKVLTIAARLHDEGKRAQRWQAAARAPDEQIYAKTRGPFNARLLDGYRHEFGSLPVAEGNPELAKLPEDQRDLVLHLIASHHGFARPVISTRGCEGAPSTLEQRAQEVALRFERLQRTWGPWGLSWWEALLRSADQQASRDNDLQDVADKRGKRS